MEKIEIEIVRNGAKNIREKIEDAVKKSEKKTGLCNVFLKENKAGLLLIENDRMLLEDIKRSLEYFFPKDKLYIKTRDSFEFQKGMLLKREVTIPIDNGKLYLDEMDGLFVFNFFESRKIEIVVTITD